MLQSLLPANTPGSDASDYPTVSVNTPVLYQLNATFFFTFGDPTARANFAGSATAVDAVLSAVQDLCGAVDPVTLDSGLVTDVPASSGVLVQVGFVTYPASMMRALKTCLGVATIADDQSPLPRLLLQPSAVNNVLLAAATGASITSGPNVRVIYEIVLDALAANSDVTTLAGYITSSSVSALLPGALMTSAPGGPDVAPFCLIVLFESGFT